MGIKVEMLNENIIGNKKKVDEVIQRYSSKYIQTNGWAISFYKGYELGLLVSKESTNQTYVFWGMDSMNMTDNFIALHIDGDLHNKKILMRECIDIVDIVKEKYKGKRCKVTRYGDNVIQVDVLILNIKLLINSKGDMISLNEIIDQNLDRIVEMGIDDHIDKVYEQFEFNEEHTNTINGKRMYSIKRVYPYDKVVSSEDILTIIDEDFNTVKFEDYTYIFKRSKLIRKMSLSEYRLCNSNDWMMIFTSNTNSLCVNLITGDTEKISNDKDIEVFDDKIIIKEDNKQSMLILPNRSINQIEGLTSEILFDNDIEIIHGEGKNVLPFSTYTYGVINDEHRKSAGIYTIMSKDNNNEINIDLDEFLSRGIENNHILISKLNSCILYDGYLDSKLDNIEIKNIDISKYDYILMTLDIDTMYEELLMEDSMSLHNPLKLRKSKARVEWLFNSNLSETVCLTDMNIIIEIPLVKLPYTADKWISIKKRILKHNCRI